MTTNTDTLAALPEPHATHQYRNGKVVMGHVYMDVPMVPVYTQEQMHAYARECIAAELRARGGRDFVMVPREPTDEMIDAAFDMQIESQRAMDSGELRNPRAEMYRAMLAAAPAAAPGE